MKESNLVQKIMHTVREKCPRVYVKKLADAHTRGLTDLLIIALSGTGRTWVLLCEVKTDGGRLSPLQEYERQEILKLHAGGDGRVDHLVARSAEDVMSWLDLRSCCKGPSPAEEEVTT